LIAAALALTVFVGAGYCAADGDVRKFDLADYGGPRMSELYFVIARDMDAALMAMSTGGLDVLPDIYRPSDVKRISGSGAASLSVTSSFHSFVVTFNTRKFPWDQKILRQAASQVVNRRKWVRDLFSGYCEPLSDFLPPISPYAARNSKPLPYGADEAKRRLAEAGWTWNRSGWLVAPDGRELPDTRILCPPSTIAATSTEIAELMADALRSIGVPATAEPIDFQTMLARINVKDFDACVNAWSMSRNPDALYAFYHSSMDVEGGYNQSGIADAELDRALRELRYAPDEPAARVQASRAQTLLADLLPVIPIYSRYSISAIRRDWDGVFTTDRSGADNLVTMLEMTPKDGRPRPIYWAVGEEIRTLNPLVSSTAYDWAVLGTIFDTMISVDPFTLENMPWLAESWDIRTEGGKTVMTFVLRDGLRWQDGRPLTAEDAAYTIGFIKKNNVPRFFDSVRDVESAEADEASRTLTVTMNSVSFWHLSNIGAGIPLLPKHILENVPDWRAWQPSNRPHRGTDGTELTELIGSGPFTFRESRTGEYIRMTRNENYFLYRGNQP
jgi:peptide/nickel transport system substrate-binding protein